jgi:malate dehydrogenase (oxaloacetate-decarboxylating)(NADP+)
MSDDALRQAALEYHAAPRPGKIGTHVFKPADSSRDLALAYSPGVAEPVLAIAENPETAYQYTNKGNLIGIVTDGSAILGLGNLGALASKPVMEGKALLFKRFAELDCVDIEIDTDNAEDFIDTVARIADSFGGINIEDVGAPQCFAIEAALKARCKVPVFHDDQHGTAICVVAGLLNALEIQGKQLDQVKVVCLGSGAAGTATLRLLRSMGVPPDHLTAVDRQGVVHADRGPLPDYKAEFARKTDARTLADALKGADVFIGVSAGGLLDAELLRSMADKPVIFALANPEPEVRPSIARGIRDDVIVATGRSDFPNQVNNVLCFPFIFRGALDVRASAITEEMKVASARAIAALAKEPVPAEVLAAYPDVAALEFGPDYILPKPMDPRLRDTVASAVAKAAIESGVAGKPYPAHYPS